MHGNYTLLSIDNDKLKSITRDCEFIVFVPDFIPENATHNSVGDFWTNNNNNSNTDHSKVGKRQTFVNVSNAVHFYNQFILQNQENIFRESQLIAMQAPTTIALKAKTSK